LRTEIDEAAIQQFAQDRAASPISRRESNRFTMWRRRRWWSRLLWGRFMRGWKAFSTECDCSRPAESAGFAAISTLCRGFRATNPRFAL